VPFRPFFTAPAEKQKSSSRTSTLPELLSGCVQDSHPNGRRQDVKTLITIPLETQETPLKATV
jgi:hypothetical protein